MKRRRRKKPTVELGGEADRLKILEIVLKKVKSALNEMSKKQEEFMRKKQEIEEDIKRGSRMTNHKLKL